ncbi:hypothetical protein BANRA_05195 [Klebsiella pneumoniae]|nr:hypothetical protein BANRA_05195 [Klebsiella pneumoniae]
MPCEYTTPEKGITDYQFDHTQGPACAMACAAATVFRNYLVPMGSQTGHSTTSQLNTLADMEKAIGIDGIRMKNGYALMSANTVQAISRYIASLDEQMRDRLRQELRIGLHSDTEVTIPEYLKIVCVSGSALPYLSRITHLPGKNGLLCIAGTGSQLRSNVAGRCSELPAYRQSESICDYGRRRSIW